jgi:hypothetical protein
VPAVDPRTPVASVAGDAPSIVRENSSPTAVLGCDDGCEPATADITEKALGRGIDPTHDSRRVEDIARHADAVQRPLDITTDFRPSAPTVKPDVWLIATEERGV